MIAPNKFATTVYEFYLREDRYDWISDPKMLERIFHSRREREILKLLEEYNRGHVVVDIGCGTGLITRHLTGELIIGLDLNVWCLEKLKERFKHISVVHGLAEKLPFRPCFADMLICTDVLEHLPNPIDTLKKIREVLKPTGVLIGSVPSKSFIWKLRKHLLVTRPIKEPFHNNYNIKEVKDMLLESGFTKILRLFKSVYGLTILFVAEK